MSGWQQAQDEHGNVYYYNLETGESVWELPEQELQRMEQQYGHKTEETRDGNEEDKRTFWEKVSFFEKKNLENGSSPIGKRDRRLTWCEQNPKKGNPPQNQIVNRDVRRLSLNLGNLTTRNAYDQGVHSQWTFKKMDSEDPDKLYSLGLSYEKGQGVRQSHSDAVKYYIMASEKGHPMAQVNLGLCYERGQGVSRSYIEAVKYYRMAAEKGNTRALYHLGRCYEFARGVRQSYSEAVKYYKLAADKGLASAQCNLGACYANGHGIVQSYSEAVKYFRKAADQGSATALCNLAVCYLYGHGVVQSLSEAVKYFRLAANKGNAKAEWSLGSCYHFGEGVAQSSTEAVKYYRKAAEKGDKFGLYLLGCCYASGEGVPQSYNEAVKYYRMAADQGEVEAQYRLGECYYHGYGVSQSYNEAVKYYTLAAKKGHALAKTQLECCLHGQRVPKSDMATKNIQVEKQPIITRISQLSLQQACRYYNLATWANEFEEKATLGTGNFGTVHKCRINNEGIFLHGSCTKRDRNPQETQEYLRTPQCCYHD